MGFFDSETSTTPKMFGPSKDLMKNVLKDATKYYNKGKTNVFTKPTFTGFGTDSNAALTGLSALAGRNSGGQGLEGNAQGIIDNGGFSDGQLRTMGGMEDLINNQGMNDIIAGDGLTDAQRGAFDSLQDTVGGNNQKFQRTFDAGGLTDDQGLVANRYRGEMSSPFDIASNPAYASVRDRALAESKMALDANAAKSGRYGGGASQSILARQQGNIAADMDLGEYRNWQQRGDAAASGLAALSQQGTNNQLGINSAQIGGLGAVSDAAQRGVDNRSSAIGQKSGMQGGLFNAQQAGLDNMGRAYDLAQKPYQTQQGVGALRDAETQKIRDDEIRQFDANDPMNIYAKFMALANGAPTGTTTQTSPSWAQMLTGGGLGLAALANAF